MKAIEWRGSSVRYIDQTKLPSEELYVETDDYRTIAEAIRALKIRGAPLIGIAAAYGAALEAARLPGADLAVFRSRLEEAFSVLLATRPTAVNLPWSIRRMKRVLDSAASTADARSALTAEAIAIHREDELMCRRIGEHGASLIRPGAGILTHCNTGVLATGGPGTAQSVITTAHRQGKNIRVYADETRPLLQGARLTAWELLREGIDVTLITDNTAGFLMSRGKIDLVIVGADRIARNGDAANKIGTYALAVLARHHRIPLVVAAPGSTIDPSLSDGSMIPIEERSADEVTRIFDRRIAPEGVNVYSPAFDITPARLITAIVSERGIHRPPYDFGSAERAQEDQRELHRQD